MRNLVITAKVTNRDNDSLKQYFREIANYERFTVEQEARCAIKASQGDENAKLELIQRNLRFVVSVAKQYETKDTPLADLINEGNLGIIKAAQRYRVDTGFKFISYAVWWVRKFITEYLSKNARTVRLPANKLSGLSKLNKQISTLEQKLGRSVDTEDVIQEIGDFIGDDDVKSLARLNSLSVESLDRNINEDSGGTTTLGDLLPNNDFFKTADHRVIENDSKTQIETLLNSLSEKERDILVMFFGLDGKEPMNLNEVGLEIGVTRERARQIKEKALKKLNKKCIHYPAFSQMKF
jgi:RNA polymerase primary sigma factor